MSDEEAALPRWDLSSDEIGSVTSEELNAHRPNRWRRAASTWRAANEQERRVWLAMQELEGRDLAVHLYNAFALKEARRRANVAKESQPWAPSKSWTAWPLKEKHVPRVNLLGRRDEAEDKYTVRCGERSTASGDLHQEIAAMVLRLANRRFGKRKRKMERMESMAEGKRGEEEGGEEQTVRVSIEEGEPMDLDEGMGFGSGFGGGEEEEEEEDDEDANKSDDGMGFGSGYGGGEGEEEQDDEDANKSDEGALPVASADDDASYRLLAPLVRHMLTQLDSTLTALHHARSACCGAMSDSADSDSSATASSPRRPAAKRPVGRPRKSRAGLNPGRPAASDTDCVPASSLSATTTDAHVQPARRRRGRPKKMNVPRPGETLDDMAIRVARQNHRALPPTRADADAAFEAWLNASERCQAHAESGPEAEPRSRVQSGPEAESGPDSEPGSRVQSGPETESGPEAESGPNSESGPDSKPRSHVESGPNSESGQGPPSAHDYSRRKQLRLGLRDWSDIVAAAALAGFSEDVLARTASRCAALFNQGMLLRRLDQVPASHGTGVDTLAFFPHRAASSPSPSPSSSPSPCPSSPRLSLGQRRLASRTSSTSRSSSTPASSLLHYCPVVSCDRAAAGFSRLANLRRHLHLLHPGVCEVPAAATSSSSSSLLHHGPRYYGLVDGDEETVGGVHVDGFLRPIRVMQGWRGIGVGGSRARGEGEDGDDEAG
ncbi:hypothetical protein CDD81_6092 [Ophiocordyceps australis]|uniref:Rrn9 domain-containing protein n=1 Tax=Ophiocordyceps australis TaxID=1399860 RepID=A0A2C5XHZ2_9HYPO|nr:hypothetical protein CDD81_6092 [Ophiocordyceps australis]